MTTGLKIAIFDYVEFLQDNRMGIVLNFSDFKTNFIEFEEQYSEPNLFNMIDQLERGENWIKNYPIFLVDDGDFIFPLDDEVKERYIEVSEQDRLAFINKLVDTASEHAEVCCKLIEEAKKNANINNEQKSEKEIKLENLDSQIELFKSETNILSENVPTKH